MLSCSTAQLLDAVAQANPQLGTLVELLNAPVAGADLPDRRRPRRERRLAVVKDAPSFGKIAAMVLFALSCFGLLLFLWLAFGGPVPLKPKGYRFHTSFAEAGQLALEADVRISGVPVGKVKTITPDKRTGRAGRRDPAAVALRAAAVGRAGDPAPEDAAGRDLRRAHAGPQLGRAIAEGGDAAVHAGLRHGRARRDPARVRPQDPRGVPGLDADAGDGDLGSRARPQRRARQPRRRSPRTPPTSSTILNRQEGAVSRLIANTGIVFGALTERDGQLRSLIENTNTVFATTAARDDELKAAFRALPTFEHESRADVRAADEFADETDPLVTQLRPAARELSPTLEDLEDIAPDLRNLLEQLQPLIDASVEGFPAAEQTLEDLRPLVAPARPGDRAARRPRSTSSASTSAS